MKFTVLCEDVKLEKSFEKIGNTIRYTVLIKNNSNFNLNWVYFYDSIPNCTSFNQNSFTWNGGTIGNGINDNGVPIGAPSYSVSTIKFDTTIIDECDCIK